MAYGALQGAASVAAFFLLPTVWIVMHVPLPFSFALFLRRRRGGPRDTALGSLLSGRAVL